jgi:hypothetical protein
VAAGIRQRSADLGDRTTGIAIPDYPPFQRSASWVVAGAVARRAEVGVHECDRHGAFAHGGGDSLDRSVADIAGALRSSPKLPSGHGRACMISTPARTSGTEAQRLLVPRRPARRR